MPQTHRGVVRPARRRPRPGLARRLRRTTLTWAVALVGLGVLVVGPTLVAAGWYLYGRAQADRPDPHHLGQEVRAGAAVFVVHEIRCGTDEDSRNGRRCEVIVTVRNAGDEALTIPGGALLLYGPDGVRYLPYESEAEPFGTLEPGDGETALIPFDVPPHVPITHVGVRADPYADDVAVAVGAEPLPLRTPN